MSRLRSSEALPSTSSGSCWAMCRRQSGLRQKAGQVSRKVPSIQRLEDLMKPLKDSNLSGQESDKSSWSLGFQIDCPLPARPACQPSSPHRHWDRWAGKQNRWRCMDHPGNLTAWSPAQGPGKSNNRTLNYRAAAARLNQHTVCSATEMQHTRLTPGPEARMLVTEP